MGTGGLARHWIHSGMVNFERRGRCRSRSATSSPSAKSPRPTISRRCATHLIGVHYRSLVAFTIAMPRRQGTPATPRSTRPKARLAYYYRTLEKLAAAPGEDDGGAGGTACRQGRWSPFARRWTTTSNTAAAIKGTCREAFLLANKLLDEPGAAAKDIAAAHAGAPAQGSRGLRRDAGDLPAPTGGAAFLDAYRLHLWRAPRDRSRGLSRRGREIAERAHRPQGEGLRPRRRDPAHVLSRDRRRADGHAQQAPPGASPSRGRPPGGTASGMVRLLTVALRQRPPSRPRRRGRCPGWWCRPCC